MNREIINKIETFREKMNRMGFLYDSEINEELTEEKRLEKSVDELIRTAARLARIFEYSPESIYVADKNGRTLTVNRAFEHTVGVAMEDVLGENVCQLEEQGFFRPSIIRLVKEEGRSMSILQKGKHGEDIIVTGVPIFDEEGKLELIVSNARMTKEVGGLYSYVREKNRSVEQREQNISHKMIIRSEPMKRIQTLAQQIKDTDVTVLITGASGVGKGVMARYIHDVSIRSEKPMVEINCGAIPETLMESELFGYTGGAFTGASAKGKEGLIESADGGTLFLDEVGEMPLSLQVKLLKFIQDKRVQRIGATDYHDVDVRIIAATNRDLKESVRQGEFREDLYYRLNVIPMEIPPLKERKEDIVEAVQHFIDKYSAKYNRSVECTREFMRAVVQYEWPGNMRELENFIERAVLTSGDGMMHMEQGLDFDVSAYEDMLESGEQSFDQFKSYVEAAEEKLVTRLYEKHRSSYKVADELGISQSKAYRLIRKYCSKDE